jgi:hypothetical protein
MASDRSPLDGLNWSQPDGRKDCAFEAAGWSCRSTGFLWFTEVRTGDERLYPCPRCNSGLFLEKSAQRASAESAQPPCACCGPGVKHLAYQSALDEVRIQKDIRFGMSDPET